MYSLSNEISIDQFAERRNSRNKKLSQMVKCVFNLTPFQLRIVDKLKNIYNCKSNSELFRHALQALAERNQLTECNHAEFTKAIHEQDSNKHYNI